MIPIIHPDGDLDELSVKNVLQSQQMIVDILIVAKKETGVWQIKFQLQYMEIKRLNTHFFVNTKL